jgi:hypothetical protein
LAVGLFCVPLLALMAQVAGAKYRALDIVAVSGAVAATAALAVHLTVLRRQRLPLPEGLRKLIDRQWDDARRHSYQYSVGSGVPPLPDIYVEQHADWLAPERERQRMTLQDMLREHRNAVVLAEPGVGKSTAVAKVLWEQCGWLLDARRSAKADAAPYGPVIPIALPPDLHGCETVPDAMAREWELANGIRPGAKLFESPPPFGNFWLVLIDGMDQILDTAARRRALEVVGAWAVSRKPAADLGHSLRETKACRSGHLRASPTHLVSCANTPQR